MYSYLYQICASKLLPVCNAFSTGVAHAQTWTSASTTALTTSTESSVASSIYAALPVVIPITVGLAVFFFFFRWLLSRAHGGR